MRVRVDRGAAALHLALSDAAEARRVEAADGVAVLYDATGHVVGVELRGVDPAACHEFTVELGGLEDRPAGAAVPAPRRPATPASPPPPPRYEGPLTWDPEAEAAMLLVPFFRRGPLRLAASALARQRGESRVTTDIVQAAGR